MGCVVQIALADNGVFAITTHDPDTGVLTNADELPTYRIYEDDTEAAILTGTMPRFDAANTTGFYLKKIEASAGNGFESGKAYTVYIEATVDGDTGGICHVFTVQHQVAGVIQAEALRRIGARAAGKISGAGTGTETITDWAGSANTLVYTVDTYGNISDVTFN